MWLDKWVCLLPAGLCSWSTQVRCLPTFSQWLRSSVVFSTHRKRPTSPWSNILSSPHLAPSTPYTTSTRPCRYVLRVMEQRNNISQKHWYFFLYLSLLFICFTILQFVVHLNEWMELFKIKLDPMKSNPLTLTQQKYIYHTHHANIFERKNPSDVKSNSRFVISFWLVHEVCY